MIDQDRDEDLGALTGSREPSPSSTGLGPSGPAREGWVEWSGGNMPVSPDTLVDVLWNNRAITKNAFARTFGPSPHAPDLWWSTDPHCRIIAYRLSRPPVEAHEIDIRIRMTRDEAAGVWYVSSSNIPGLSLEAGTPDLLLRRIADCAFDLIELNAASGIETEGHDGETRHGAEHESPAPKGDAQ